MLPVRRQFLRLCRCPPSTVDRAEMQQTMVIHFRLLSPGVATRLLHLALFRQTVVQQAVAIYFWLSSPGVATRLLHLALLRQTVVCYMWSGVGPPLLQSPGVATR